jgi:hypothetical protein
VVDRAFKWRKETSGKNNACRTEGCVAAPWAALTLRGCHMTIIPSVRSV